MSFFLQTDITSNVGRQSSQDNNKTVDDKLNQELAKDLKTTSSCQNTTKSNVKTTNSSGLYLHHDTGTQ